MTSAVRRLSIDDLLGHGDDNDGERAVSNERATVDNSMVDTVQGSPTHLSQHESEAALNMASKYAKGMLKKTDGTWYFW
jgi:hypothetical protein